MDCHVGIGRVAWNRTGRGSILFFVIITFVYTWVVGFINIYCLYIIFHCAHPLWSLLEWVLMAFQCAKHFHQTETWHFWGDKMVPTHGNLVAVPVNPLAASSWSARLQCVKLFENQFWMWGLMCPTSLKVHMLCPCEWLWHVLTACSIVLPFNLVCGWHECFQLLA